MRVRDSVRRIQGFTLVELLVAFAILALVVGLAPTAFERMREGAQYRDVVRTMFAQLRTARTVAVTDGREVRFVVDFTSRRYGVEGKSLKPLPDTVQLRATVADRELDARGQASIRFLPSGGATGGSIEILRAPGVGTRLRVDWLSGRVTQEALAL